MPKPTVAELLTNYLTNDPAVRAPGQSIHDLLGRLHAKAQPGPPKTVEETLADYLLKDPAIVPAGSSEQHAIGTIFERLAHEHYKHTNCWGVLKGLKAGTVKLEQVVLDESEGTATSTGA